MNFKWEISLLKGTLVDFLFYHLQLLDFIMSLKN